MCRTRTRLLGERISDAHSTSQQRTDWSALVDQVILKDLPAEDKKGLEDFLDDAPKDDEKIKCFKCPAGAKRTNLSGP